MTRMSRPARMLVAAVVSLVMVGPGALGSSPPSVAQEARKFLEGRDYFSAIALLEPALPGAQNNPDLLDLLRRAYKGRSQELLAQGRKVEAQLYLDRLTILDPVPASATPAQTGAAQPERKTAVLPAADDAQAGEPGATALADTLQASRPGAQTQWPRG